MNKVQTLIEELKRENEVRDKQFQEATTFGECLDLKKEYNLTLDFIKKLENLSF